MRRCVASTWPDSRLKRMYLPRRPTLVMRALRNCRSKPGREMPGAMRLRFSSAATIRRPTTTGDKARTTCSTSGNSGIVQKTLTQRRKDTKEDHRIFLCVFAPLRENSSRIDYFFDLFLDLAH